MTQTRRLVVMLLAGVLPVGGQADQSPKSRKGRPMSKQTADAKEQLVRFDETRDPAQLEAAIRGLEHVQPRPEQGQDLQAARRDVMRLWLEVLAALQRAKDPTFDPHDLPMSSVAPPPLSNGARYPAGVDPKSIPEADVRAQYEAALAKNREKAETYRIQSRLRFLEERAKPDVEGFIRRNYSKSDSDRAELKALVEGAQIPPQERQRVLSIEASH